MNDIPDRPYTPPLLLRNGHIQTFLASSPLQALGSNPMQAAARAEIVVTDNGARLLGVRSRRTVVRPKGLVILLHGWEGSSESTYIRRTGGSLYRCRYDVFRLNFRDHDPSHHLNPGFFFAAHLDEVFDAVYRASQESHPLPVFLRIIHRHGGHNGFLEGPTLRSRYESELPNLFDRLTRRVHSTGS